MRPCLEGRGQGRGRSRSRGRGGGAPQPGQLCLPGPQRPPLVLPSGPVPARPVPGVHVLLCDCGPALGAGCRSLGLYVWGSIYTSPGCFSGELLLLCVSGLLSGAYVFLDMCVVSGSIRVCIVGFSACVCVCSVLKRSGVCVCSEYELQPQIQV